MPSQFDEFFYGQPASPQAYFGLPTQYGTMQDLFPQMQSNDPYVRQISEQPAQVRQRSFEDVGPQDMGLLMATGDPLGTLELAKKIRSEREANQFLKELAPLDPTEKDFSSQINKIAGKYTYGAQSPSVQHFLNLKALQAKAHQESKYDDASEKFLKDFSSIPFNAEDREERVQKLIQDLPQGAFSHPKIAPLVNQFQARAESLLERRAKEKALEDERKENMKLRQQGMNERAMEAAMRFGIDLKDPEILDENGNFDMQRVFMRGSRMPKPLQVPKHLEDELGKAEIEVAKAGHDKDMAINSFFNAHGKNPSSQKDMVEAFKLSKQDAIAKLADIQSVINHRYRSSQLSEVGGDEAIATKASAKQVPDKPLSLIEQPTKEFEERKQIAEYKSREEAAKARIENAIIEAMQASGRGGQDLDAIIQGYSQMPSGPVSGPRADLIGDFLSGIGITPDELQRKAVSGILEKRKQFLSGGVPSATISGGTQISVGTPRKIQ